MIIRERELELLGVIDQNPDVTPVALILKLKGHMSKALIYELLSALEAKDLVVPEIKGGGASGTPVYRAYNITRRGKRINHLAKEMQKALEAQDIPDLEPVAG